MNRRISLTFILLILGNATLLAAPTLLESEKFDHLVPGCPHNSSCGEGLGQVRLLWLALIGRPQVSLKDLQTFLKRHGLPFQGVASEEGDPAAAYWDDPCPNKTSGPRSLFQKFFKKLPPPSSQRDLTRWTLLEGEKSTTYPAPLKGAPKELRPPYLIFSYEAHGHYFDLAISPAGTLKLLPFTTSQMALTPTPCPAATQAPSPLLSGRSCYRHPRGLLIKHQVCHEQ